MDSWVLRNHEQSSFFTTGGPAGWDTTWSGWEERGFPGRQTGHCWSPSGVLCSPGVMGCKHGSWGRGQGDDGLGFPQSQRGSEDSGICLRHYGLIHSSQRKPDFSRSQEFLGWAWESWDESHLGTLGALGARCQFPDSARILAHAAIKRTWAFMDALSPFPHWYFTPRPHLGIGEHTLSQSYTREVLPQARTRTWTCVHRQSYSLPGDTSSRATTWALVGNPRLPTQCPPSSRPATTQSAAPLHILRARCFSQQPPGVQNSFQETYIQWIILQKWREINTFTAIQTLREFITSISSLK